MKKYNKSQIITGYTMKKMCFHFYFCALIRMRKKRGLTKL